MDEVRPLLAQEEARESGVRIAEERESGGRDEREPAFRHAFESNPRHKGARTMISDKISSFPAIAMAEEAVVTSSSTVDCATAVGALAAAVHL